MAQVGTHTPVMLARIVELLRPALTPTGGTDAVPVLVDCTLGLGGHALALLEACPQAHLIGLDRDPYALAAARERLARFADRTTLVQAVYDELPDVLAAHGHPSVQGIVMDLGLSSLQIDSVERGFAYAADAPLDMRMGAGDQPGPTAADVLNTYPYARLVQLLRRYGDEPFAERIARAVVAAREIEPFTTSARLVEVIVDAVPRRRHPRGGHQRSGHPAKRTFQALRIEVNDELEVLAAAVPAAVAALAVGGRLAVLAYHSGEDRLVKQVLRAGSTDTAPPGLPVVPEELRPRLQLLTRGAEKPDPAEIDANPRAASARLRAAERIRAAA